MSIHANNAKLSHDHDYRIKQSIPNGGEFVSSSYEGKDHKRKLVIIYKYKGELYRTKIAAKTTPRSIYG